ncbi:LuxR family transcriptional regulator [Flaviflexus salsibiostraticola]|uniref:LuxR family transcriptional regulator n=1 Tax=Flaviflexus salsibiostraticola TaxID=1282737 RepID=A0A3S8Z6B2_9ACTO|nr:helix-turn-helix transcriptional regulator [Flaviflexus salsibiostraticola]AZN29010.1 LuxR family transcriptional regulator [Flaviflexus salsibiostraticola]
MSPLLRRVVLDQRLGGAILIGRAGSGRRATFDAAVAGIEPRPTVIHLNGSPFAAQTRYGVLSLMLSRLETTPSVSRHELVRAVATLIGEQRTIVTLGSPDFIDGDSAAVLAQLAAMRKISLVVVCERTSQLPADISALHRSGLLVRIDVPGMDAGRTKSFLEAELGGPVSMFAAAVLWRLCRASRALIRQVAREFAAQGRLRIEGGTWILVPGPVHIPAGIRVPHLASVSREERRLLLLLAQGGPASMSALRHCGLAGEVNSLRSRGLVTVEGSRSESVDLAVPLVGHILRERADESELADEAVREVYADPQAARVLTEARAMRDVGDDAGAVAAIETFSRSGGFSADAWRTEPNTRGLILEVQVRALLTRGRHASIDTCLARAAEGLASAVKFGAGGRSHVQAEQLLGLLSAYAAVITGRPRQALGLTEVLWETEALHLKALAVQAEAWAVADRQREALSIVASIDSDIAALRLAGVLDEVMTPWECADIECTLLKVRLLAGDWRAAARAASRLAEGRYPVPHAIAFGDVVGGMLSALAHETDEALSILLPAMHQLSVLADGAVPAGIRAAAAFCLADLDHGDAESLSAPIPDPELSSSDFLGWAGAVLDCLRRGRDDAAGAIVDLVELADRCHDRGAETLEMGALAAALRLGDTSGADRLGQLSARSSAPAAEGYRLLARSVVRGDPSALAEGLERLIRCGQHLYSHGQGGVLVERLSRQDQRRVLAAAFLETPGGPSAESEPAGHARQAWLTHLTKREAQIAKQAISGMTNTAIARVNGVSVRTVEGHLYQVYSKLHVRNRQELAALARPGRSSSRS